VNTRAPSFGALLTIVVFSLSCFLGGVYVFKRFGGTLPLEAKGFRFHVAFPQGGNIQRNTDVRISGVSVGKVVSVKPAGQRTDALVQLDTRYAPLHADARALLRVKTLLGEPFIALTPGTSTAPRLHEGAHLADSQVQDNQQLDQVLAAFDKPARRSLRDLTLELAAAFKGRDAQLNAALGTTAGAADALDALATELDAQRPQLTGLVRSSGIALEALGARADSLRRVVRSGDAVFGVTARRDRELQATIDALAPFLARLQPTARKLSATLDDAAPTLHALRPAAHLLGPGLARVDALLPVATRVLRRLPAVLATAKRTLPDAVALTGQVGSASGALDQAGRELVPVLQYIEANRDDIVQNTGKLAASTAGFVTQADGTKLHYLRVLLVFTNELLLGAKQRPGSNRHAAYPAPGALAKLGAQQSSSCANVNNPTPIPPLSFGGAMPCVQQPPWTLRGKTASFPQLTRDPEQGTTG
jgi:phospholipid/cholesterol/gamma-HCH transport system substrate-binding protein